MIYPHLSVLAPISPAFSPLQPDSSHPLGPSALPSAPTLPRLLGSLSFFEVQRGLLGPP